MHAIKTAISLEKTLFEQAVQIARVMKVSRSKLVALALKSFIEHQNNKEMLAQINEAYSDEPDTTEQTLRQKLRREHRRIVREEW